MSYNKGLDLIDLFVLGGILWLIGVTIEHGFDSVGLAIAKHRNPQVRSCIEWIETAKKDSTAAVLVNNIRADTLCYVGTR